MASTLPPRPSQQPPRRTGYCYSFARTGRCNAKGRCRYRHIKETEVDALKPAPPPPPSKPKKGPQDAIRPRYMHPMPKQTDAFGAEGAVSYSPAVASYTESTSFSRPQPIRTQNEAYGYEYGEEEAGMVQRSTVMVRLTSRALLYALETDFGVRWNTRGLGLFQERPRGIPLDR